MSAIAPTAPAPRGTLDRFLRIFTDVHDGEGGQVLLLAFNVFLILTAYYVMKPVREALILAQPGGAEIKSYSTAAQAVLFAIVVPAYGALATRLPRRRLINIVTAFFIACLPLFYLAAEASLPVGVPFFLWIGAFSLMLIAQFWAYANDLYTPDAGKRLFALVAFGASAGAVFGAFISSHLINALGVNELLLIAAAILAASLMLFNFIDLRVSAGAAVRARAGTAVAPAPPIGDGNAFALVLRNRYLLLVAALIFAAQLGGRNRRIHPVLDRFACRAGGRRRRQAGAGARRRVHRCVLCRLLSGREHRRDAASRGCGSGRGNVG